MALRKLTRSEARLFWSKVDRSAGPNACWPRFSKKPLGKDAHYGSFPFAGHSVLMHVVAWALTHRRWPRPGMQVLHSCDWKPCCNPRHLREGTPAQNRQDQIERPSEWVQTRAAQRQQEPFRIVTMRLYEEDVAKLESMSAPARISWQQVLRRVVHLIMPRLEVNPGSGAVNIRGGRIE